MSQAQDCTEPLGRVLALDVGDVRVGVAISDTARRVATPRGILSGFSERELFLEIEHLVADEDVSLVLVGLPLSMNGAVGEAARRAIALADSLRARLSVPVASHDERLTTVEATRRLNEAEQRSRRRGTARSTRPRAHRRVDDTAAVVLLQSYLDRAPRR